jgi:hypothetical protein
MAYSWTQAFFLLCRYLPRQISDEEMIVRAIFSPFHIDKKNGKLTRAAFDPTAETDEISVMRASILGMHRCKSHAKKLENPKVSKAFKGFAVLSVREVRAIALVVVDSRKGNFLGHGDIKSGVFMPPRGVPKEPEQIRALRAVADQLISKSHYCSDPNPQKRRWMGDPLIR